MRFLLKTIGTAEHPVEDFWVHELWDLRRVAFPKHRQPQIDPGDRVVLYATWHQRLIAAGVFTSQAVRDPVVLREQHRWDKADADRWPYVATWEPQVVLPYVHLGPHLTESGVGTLSVRSQSHIHIDEAKYRRAVGLLATAAASSGEVYVPAYRDALPVG